MLHKIKAKTHVKINIKINIKMNIKINTKYETKLIKIYIIKYKRKMEVKNGRKIY